MKSKSEMALKPTIEIIDSLMRSIRLDLDRVNNLIQMYNPVIGENYNVKNIAFKAMVLTFILS